MSNYMTLERLQGKGKFAIVNFNRKPKPGDKVLSCGHTEIVKMGAGTDPAGLIVVEGIGHLCGGFGIPVMQIEKRA